MGKTNFKNRSRKVGSRIDRRQKEQKLKTENVLDDEDLDNNEGLDNDFFLDDGEEVDFRQLNDDDEESEDFNDENLGEEGSQKGSDLDYDDELELSGEDSLVEEDEKEEKEKKVFKISAEKYKSIKAKALKGSSYHINQCIVIFLKAINLNENNIEDEEEDFVDAEKTKKNIF